MTSTLISTDLASDRCPRCGDRLGERTTIERLRSALEPFTKLGGPNDGVMPAFHDLEDDVVIYTNSGECITAGDVRIARDAFGILHAPYRPTKSASPNPKES